MFPLGGVWDAVDARPCAVNVTRTEVGALRDLHRVVSGLIVRLGRADPRLRARRPRSFTRPRGGADGDLPCCYRKAVETA